MAAEAPVCADDALFVSPGEHAVVSYLQGQAHARMIPLNVSLELTLRCNIRCLHCYNFDRDTRGPACGSDGASAEPELSLDEIFRVMGELREAGCLFLSLTGGEVLSSPHLFPVLDRARDLGFAVQLLSNGTLLRPGVAARLASYRNLMGVSVSLYGATPEVHDGITQVRGSWRRTLDGVDRLRAQKVAVRLKLIVMRPNAHEVAAMRALAAERGLPTLIDLTITARHDGTSGSLAVRVSRGAAGRALPRAAGRPAAAGEPGRRRRRVRVQLRARQRRDLGARRGVPVRLGPLVGRQRAPAAVRRDLAQLAGVPEDPRTAHGRLPGLRPLPRQVLLLARSRRRLQRVRQLHRQRSVRLHGGRRRARPGASAATTDVRSPRRVTCRWPSERADVSGRPRVAFHTPAHAAVDADPGDQTDAGRRREAVRVLEAGGRRAARRGAVDRARADARARRRPAGRNGQLRPLLVRSLLQRVPLGRRRSADRRPLLQHRRPDPHRRPRSSSGGTSSSTSSRRPPVGWTCWTRTSCRRRWTTTSRHTSPPARPRSSRRRTRSSPRSNRPRVLCIRWCSDPARRPARPGSRGTRARSNPATSRVRLVRLAATHSRRRRQQADDPRSRHAAIAQRLQGHRARALGQPLAARRDHQRDVRERGNREPQRASERDLPRCRAQQVGAPDHPRDAHGRVVDDHRQLVGGGPVRAAQHEVVDAARIALRRAVHLVGERDPLGRAPRTGRPAPAPAPLRARGPRPAVGRGRCRDTAALDRRRRRGARSPRGRRRRASRHTGTPARWPATARSRRRSGRSARSGGTARTGHPGRDPRPSRSPASADRPAAAPRRRAARARGPGPRRASRRRRRAHGRRARPEEPSARCRGAGARLGSARTARGPSQ